MFSRLWRSTTDLPRPWVTVAGIGVFALAVAAVAVILLSTGDGDSATDRALVANPTSTTNTSRTTTPSSAAETTTAPGGSGSSDVSSPLGNSASVTPPAIPNPTSTAQTTQAAGNPTLPPTQRPGVTVPPTAHPTATPAPTPPPSAPPPPQPTAKPSALPQWNECASTWSQGTQVEAIKYQIPGLWSDDYERLLQSLISYHQTYCVGIGGRLAETDGGAHCSELLSGAATLQLLMNQIPLWQSLYFPPRKLDEMRGYINAAGC